LVGSIPLANSRQVLETVSAELGPLAPRIPDGETGDRSIWIQFQKQSMDKATNLVKVREFTLAPEIVQPIYKVAAPGEPVVFGDLRYAREAIRSYGEFAELKAEGVVPAETRFQVSLPTPLAVTAGFIEESSQQQVEAAYEARLLAELDEIVSTVPAEALSIQWDVAYEVIFLAGWTGSRYFDQSRSALLERLIRLGNAVPSGVELGYHLCYGDPGHKHLIEPEDLGLCVDISNALAEGVRRPIQWIHMPVPRDRADDAYFAPLRGLRKAPSTEISIGLVHYTDGVEGARRRLEVAKRFLPTFGVAAECGFGRRSPAVVRDLLVIHRQVAMLD
jgi:hypothetical protein